MKVVVRSAQTGGDLFLGVLYALQYPLNRQQRNVPQRVSFGLFVNGLRRISKSMMGISVVGSDELNVNEYLRYLLRMLGKTLPDSYNCVAYREDHYYALLPKPGKWDCHVDVVARQTEKGQFEFEADPHDPRLEAAIMMNWGCLDYDLTKMDVTIEGHTLCMGMWLAAKLYECHGDVAGKLATIDEALDMR